jgi:tetratricopeptide (TPR) repeat protein
MKTVSLIVIFALTTLSFVKADVICKKNGKKQTVKKLTADAKGTIQYSAGKFKMKLKKSEYLWAWVKNPKDIKALNKKFKKKQYKDVVTGYEKAAVKYKYLGWDVFCLYKQAYALNKLGNTSKAISILKPLYSKKIKNPKKEKVLMQAFVLLADIYIKTNQEASATPILARLAQAKNNDLVAESYIKRGDILRKQGKREDAVLAYLTVGNNAVKSKLAPVGLRKAANTLKELNDTRADKYIKKLKTNYAKSKEIGKLK